MPGVKNKTQNTEKHVSHNDNKCKKNSQGNTDMGIKEDDRPTKDDLLLLSKTAAMYWTIFS